MAEYVDEGWHPRKLAFLNTAGLILSVVSSLDCQFLSIIVGFDPKNSEFDAGAIGAGMWSFQSPIQPEECLLFTVAQTTKMVTQDSSYETVMLNGDIYWSIARVSALVSVIFGLSGSILMWHYVITGTKNPSKRKIVSLTILAITFESLKTMFFFRNHLCTVPQWELPSQMVEELTQEDFMPSFNTFRKASACMFNRGSFFAIASLCLYLATLTFVGVYLYRSYQYDYEFKEAFRLQRKLTTTTGLRTSGRSSGRTLGSIRDIKTEEMVAVLKPSKRTERPPSNLRKEQSFLPEFRSERNVKPHPQRSERSFISNSMRSERPFNLKHHKSERSFRIHHPRSERQLPRAKTQRHVQTGRSERILPLTRGP